MAQKVLIQTLSDLSEKEGAKTLSYALDGTSYEIDLTDEEAEEFRETLAPYVVASRKVGGQPPRKKK